MGAWGIKYFDNDDAGDFVTELSDGASWSIAEAVFASVLAVGDEYLDAAEASAAVAAAAVVANKKSGLMVSNFPDDLIAFASLPSPSHQLASLALQVLARIQREPSELMGLWDDAGEKDEWIATLKVLEEALSA